MPFDMGGMPRAETSGPDILKGPVTAQQIYDRVRAHLLRQRCKASVPSPGGIFQSCRYRTADGRRCAVGVLLTETEIEACPEGKTVDGLLDRGLLPARLVPHLDLLRELQCIHDNHAVKEWPYLLDKVACICGLERKEKTDAV